MCGIFGITGNKHGKLLFPLSLKALQHRGHDAAGVAGFTSKNPYTIEGVKGLGKVSNHVNTKTLEKFLSNTLIGHTRYATRNQASSSREIHPHFRYSLQGKVALVTNGDLKYTDDNLAYLKKHNVRLYTGNDAEMIASLIQLKYDLGEGSMSEVIAKVMPELQGGFSALLLHEDKDCMYAFRDPWGIRPLYVATFVVDGEKSYAVSSETCSFDLIHRYHNHTCEDENTEMSYRAVAPGEIIVLEKGKEIQSSFIAERKEKNIGCVFETVYFSRPDSKQDYESFQKIRQRMGEMLYEENPIEADIVTAVPKGGIPAAVGYACKSKTPYAIGVLEEPSNGGVRSFITNEGDRKSLARMKYNILNDIVEAKRVVVVDDSIVRGTTAKLLVKNLFEAGAKEVHLRIPCPPYSFACHYGVETKDPEKLISHKATVDEICKKLGATSLCYLSLDGLYKAIGKERNLFCDECLTNKQPF